MLDALNEQTDQLRSWWNETDFDDAELESPPESLLISGAAIAAGLLTRNVLTKLWTRFCDSEPPTNPQREPVGWKDALIWTASVGAAVGVSRMLGRYALTAAAKRVSS